MLDYMREDIIVINILLLRIPLAMSLTLYCLLSFLRNTYLQPVAMESFERSTNVHVWFLSKDSIFYSMAVIHLPWSSA